MTLSKNLSQAFILLCFLLSHLSMNAQETYAETLRKRDWKAYNDEYLKAVRNSDNRPVDVSFKVDPKAAQELADLFAARAGRETSAQKEARMEKARADYETYKQKEAVINADLAQKGNEDDARKNAVLLPMANYYKSAGFTSEEATFLGSGHVSLSKRYDGFFDYSLIKDAGYFDAANAIREFNQRFATASFEELFMLVSDFAVTGYSAVISFDRLAKRFPEKAAVLEAATPDIMAGYWMPNKDHRTPANFFYSSHKEMGERFSRLYNKYPLVAINLAASVSNSSNPISDLLAEARASKKKKDIARYEEALARVTIQYLKTTKHRSLEVHHMLAAGRERIGEFTLTPADIIEIGKNFNLRPRNVIEYMSRITMDGMATSYEQYGRVQYPDKYEIKKYGFDKLIKEMADNGDADALNAYALRVAAGKEKQKPEEAIAIFKRAADAGSVMATYNLVLASDWGLKGYGPENKAEALSRWKQYKSNDSVDNFNWQYYNRNLKGL